MITFLNNPIADLIAIVERLYPDIEAEVQFVSEQETPGEVVFPENEIVPLISVRGDIPYEAVLEILAHELAHVAVGYGNEEEHGPLWEAAFGRIHQEYMKEQSDNPEVSPMP